MNTLTKPQMDAALEFATATIAALKVEKGVHPETLVVASARMAGAYLFRSFGLKLPGVAPGQAVLSVEASEESPALIRTAAGALAMIGIRLANAPPAEATDPKHKPMLDFLETQRRLEPVYAPIRARHGLSSKESAHAAAGAVALLIRHCAKALDPSVAFAIASYGFMEGSKTAPDPSPGADGMT